MIPLCSLHRIFDSENVRWETIKLQKIVGNLLDKLRKLYLNGKVFSLPQAIESSRQVLLLRTDISQKTVVGCP